MKFILECSSVSRRRAMGDDLLWIRTKKWTTLNSESHPPALSVRFPPPAGGGTFIFCDPEGRGIKPLDIKGPEYYYLFASRRICCKGLESTYHIVMGRSKDIKGPYLNKDGESWVDNHYTLFLEGNKEEPGQGYNGFFSEYDTNFVLYYAYPRSVDGAPLLNIKPLYTDDDGWAIPDDTSRDLFQRLKYITP